VWDWDDGNPATVEGTVSALSYVTGNYVTFNIQLGGSWEAPYITYYGASTAEMTPTGFVQAPASVWGSPQQLGFRRVQAWGQPTGGYSACQVKGFQAGGRCIGRAAGDYARTMAQHAAVGALVGGGLGATGWILGPPGGLAGALGGALTGEAVGAIEGLVAEFIFGVDHHCVDEANIAHDRCQWDLLACNSFQRAADWCDQEFGPRR